MNITAYDIRNVKNLALSLERCCSLVITPKARSHCPGHDVLAYIPSIHSAEEFVNIVIVGGFHRGAKNFLVSGSFTRKENVARQRIKEETKFRIRKEQEEIIYEVCFYFSFACLK